MGDVWRASAVIFGVYWYFVGGQIVGREKNGRYGSPSGLFCRITSFLGFTSDRGTYIDHEGPLKLAKSRR